MDASPYPNITGIEVEAERADGEAGKIAGMKGIRGRYILESTK